MKTSLNYRMTGPQDAPVVTLAHGLATDLSMWDGVTLALEREFRVLRYDARGHGGTPAYTDAYTLAELEQDVIDLLDSLEIATTCFVGLSMGGMVGMGLGLKHADRLNSLVVCDARADAPSSYRESWSDRIAKVEAGGIDAIAEQTVQRWFTEAFKSDAAAMERMRAMVKRTSVDGYIGCAKALRELDYARRLPELSAPTLFLVGAQDAGAPPQVMRDMHAATPGSEFALIDGAGHISAVEKPDEVAGAILKFIAGGGSDGQNS